MKIVAINNNNSYLYFFIKLTKSNEFDPFEFSLIKDDKRIIIDDKIVIIGPIANPALTDAPPAEAEKLPIPVIAAIPIRTPRIPGMNRNLLRSTIKVIHARAQIMTMKPCPVCIPLAEDEKLAPNPLAFDSAQGKNADTNKTTVKIIAVILNDDLVIDEFGFLVASFFDFSNSNLFLSNSSF
jgi:hypothetical protein